MVSDSIFSILRRARWGKGRASNGKEMVSHSHITISPDPSQMRNHACGSPLLLRVSPALIGSQSQHKVDQVIRGCIRSVLQRSIPESNTMGCCWPDQQLEGSSRFEAWTFSSQLPAGRCCLKSDMSVGKIHVSGKNRYSCNGPHMMAMGQLRFTLAFGNCFRIRSKLRPCDVRQYKKDIHTDDHYRNQR